MSENHKLFGFGEKRHTLRPEDAEVLRSREAIMNGAVNGVFYAIHRMNERIAGEVESELAQAAIEPQQTADHQLLADAALGASLNTVTSPEVHTDAQSLDLGKNEPINTAMFDAMADDITPDEPRIALLNDREVEYELAS